ncbi:MAG: hypothetical protein ABUS79_26985, partial [Pseudomonadota bacterium]
MSVLIGVGACDAGSIHAVGSPGGVYRPDQGCTLKEATPSCPAFAQIAPALRFESPQDPDVEPVSASGTLSNLAVTCRRSYCGTGSLVAAANLRWTDDPEYPQRKATFRYELDSPRDLAGRTVAFAIYVEDVTVPMHAQIGVIFDFWRWVAWAPLSQGWNTIAGVVSPANPLTKIDPGVTAIPVTALQIDVYV